MQSSIPDPSLLQQITPQFSIFKGEQNLLGRGAFGSVYRGYSKSQKKVIAIKHIKVDQNYLRQIQTLKTLSSLIHPNIMGFYGFQQHQKDVYLFIQLCQNGNLTSLISKGLTQSQILKYFRQMIQGMCYMNAKGKMHRDLKPDNILIGNNFDLKISDFGLARQNDNIMMTGHKGTPLYAAPEVFSMEEKYTANCDVWSAGLILSEMLTGERSFKNVKTLGQLNKQWDGFAKGAKTIKYDQTYHPLWEYFTNIMLTHDHKKRPSFHQILQILKKCYKKMEQQIQNISFKNKNNQKLVKLENYLNFQCQKYEILLKTTQYDKLPQNIFLIMQPIFLGLSFLSLCIYLTHMKKLIRELINKSIQLPDYDQQLIQNQSKDYQIILCLDKYRNSLQTSYTYYSNLIKTQILQKIQEKQLIKDDFYKEMKLNQMVIDVQKGMFGVEDSYIKKLKQIVGNQHFKLPEKKLKGIGQDFLKFYTFIIIGANLKKIFSQDKYNNENYVKNYVNEIQNSSENALIGKIRQF